MAHGIIAARFIEIQTLFWVSGLVMKRAWREGTEKRRFLAVVPD
jgi:hypothetical protein